VAALGYLASMRPEEPENMKKNGSAWNVGAGRSAFQRYSRSLQSPKSYRD